MTSPLYPEITRACPVGDQLDDHLDGSFCRKCRTHVADLDTMTEASRLRLLAETTGALCIRYRLPALAAAAAMAGSLPPAMAQQQATPTVQQTAAEDEPEVIVGTMRRLTIAERIAAERRAAVAERRAAAAKRRAEKAARTPKP